MPVVDVKSSPATAVPSAVSRSTVIVPPDTTVLVPGGPTGWRLIAPVADDADPLVLEAPAGTDAGPIAALIADVLDGRNAHLADGVQQALGRPPRDFGDYARQAAASGVWDLAQTA